ncbi:hypothetical protein ACFPK1_16505 [Actinomycetospora rhizophila]|uniref:Uncharacterized protein n=1 Tax=Actinomycetospora rhizophila TaxID=1416876 RepID=A0ABV9ZK53_9PSEU
MIAWLWVPVGLPATLMALLLLLDVLDRRVTRDAGSPAPTDREAP